MISISCYMQYVPRPPVLDPFPAPPRPLGFWPCPAPPCEKKSSLSIPTILASRQISHLDLPAKQRTSRKSPLLDFAVFEMSSGRQSLPWGGSQGCDGRNSVLFCFPDNGENYVCGKVQGVQGGSQGCDGTGRSSHTQESRNEQATGLGTT